VCSGALKWLAREPVSLSGVEVWAPLAYAGPARAVVAALKFRGAERVSTAMAAAIAANAPPDLLAGRVLVPVPLHPRRKRTRGYNQAERLAAALAARSGLPVADCLVRRGRPGTQMGRTRSQRAAGLDGAVSARRTRPIPARAVLVDDVVTTGATLGACARALAVAGCEEVVAVAYARTPGR